MQYFTCMRLALVALIGTSLIACGPPVDDTDWPEPDAGEDLFVSEVDAGTTNADAGVSIPDAGLETSDAGTTPPDAGITTADAGLTTPDAGTTTRDAGSTPSPDAGATLRIVVLSDLNGSYGATTYDANVHAAVNALKTTLQPDLVLISGDMVAGQQAGLNYPAMWAGFHAAVTTPITTAGIPVAPAPGNHDASAYPGYQVERDEYQRQWQPTRRPAVQFIDATNFPFRYSFVFKGAFFIALDATTVAPLSGAQRAWVEQQLLLAAPYRVRIVFGHVPLLPTTVGRESETLNDVTFENLLRTHGAVFIGGHQHGYFPGAINGLRHVVAPCVGAGPRPLIGTTGASPRGFVVIDVANDRITSLQARTGSTFTSTISRSSLPASLTWGGRSLQRDDLAGF